MKPAAWRKARREYIKRWRDKHFPMDDIDSKCATYGCVNRASRAMGNGFCTSCTRARKQS